MADTVVAVVVAAALLIVAVSPAAAKRAPTMPPSVVTIDTGRPAAASYVRSGMRLSARNGLPLAIYGTDVVVDAAPPVTMARQYLAADQARLGLRHPDLSDLSHRFTRQSAIGWTVRFDQTCDGVPVLGAEIAVSIGPDRRVIFVSSTYEPDVALPAADATVAAATARHTALEHLGMAGAHAADLELDRNGLVAFATVDGWRLAHRVELVPRTGPIGDWEILVDAIDGTILRAIDRAHHVDGSGDVFDPDPLSVAGATYGDPGFVDGNDQNTPELEATESNVVLRDIDFSGGLYTLKGPWAEVSDFEGPFYGLFQEADGTWDFNRFDNGFEAALCYYHIDHTMRWLNLDLGLVIEPFQYSGGARFDPHGLNGADNSHYIGSTGRMAFGEGGVDDSEDADVVIHELGHALHDWVTGGSLSQVDGLSEGTGDFAAASYSRSLGQWTPSDPQYQWVFSWDGHNPFWSGRVTNYGAHYPDGLTGSIHTDGQIWSTCLMRIWDQIGREKTDQSCWAGLGMTGSGSSQNDAANAMLQAAIAYGYSQSDISAIVAEFQQTGYTVGAPPEIDVSPLAFTFAVPAGGMDTQQLTIQNLTDPGLGAALEYTISSFEELPFTGGTSVILGRRSAGDRPAAVVSKGAVDLRTGSPPAEDFGGPDAFGYVWFDSDEPGGPVFDWQDISGVGTSHTLSDDGSVVVNLPFNFPFYGQNESSVRISANGYLTFGPTGGTYTNTGIPDGSSPNELIAGFWDDLNPSLGGTIHSYHDAGTSSFIVQWTGIQHYGGSAPYTFQIVLRASGEILYQYQSMQGDLTSATLGIENAAGDTGLEVVYNAPYVHDGLAVLFRQLAACPWIEANPSSGTVPPQGTQVVDITVDATGLALGEHACTLIVSSNDDDESTIMIPVSLTVGSTSAVETAAAGPRATRLLGNVPNPFNPATTVRYELAHAATVRLSIYDEAGRLVRVLVDGAPVDAGRHAVRWDGRDGTGREVSSGVYFYRLEAGELASTRRGVLLR